MTVEDRTVLRFRRQTLGLIVSIVQATTSIQEQTLTFVPKIAAILGALMLFGPWMFSSMVEFTIRLFERIPEMGG